MGVCESNIRGRKNIELKKGICLFIKNNINSIINYYYIYINYLYVPFLITSINNIKDENDKILLYDKNYMISLYKLQEKKEYEKYGYVFFEFGEKLIPKIPIIFPINNNILKDKKDEVSVGNHVNLLYYQNNLKDFIPFKIKITEKNDIIFKYKYVDNNEIDSYYNLIVDSENNIIGVKLEKNCAILIKPIIKGFDQLIKKKFPDINSSQSLNHRINNTIIYKKYIISVLLSLAKIEKLKDINDNSFKIEEIDVINCIIKFIKYYDRNKISKAKKSINKFENLYDEVNINYQKLFDFISYKSYLKFHIDKIVNNSFIQNQNIIQKKLFMIYENEEQCNDINKQYICNSMYLYSKNKQCNNIQNLINEWENEEKGKDKCSKCLNKHFIKRKIIYWPEILTIILNNNNYKVKDIDKLKLPKYEIEYKLICCIEEHSENKNYVLYKEQNKWHKIKTDDNFTEKEIKNKINPCVLFYEKINNNRHKSFDGSINESQKTNRINNNSNGENMNLNIGNENNNKLQGNKSFINKNYKNLDSINSSKSKNPISDDLLNKTNNPNSDKLNNQTSNTILNLKNIPNHINHINLKKPKYNIILNKNNFPYSISPNNLNNTPYYIHANKYYNYTNLNSNNSHLYNQRSCTPTPIIKTSKKYQNLNINKIDTTNKNYVNAHNIDNHKKSINEVYYNPNIVPFDKNNKLLLSENKNKLNINNDNSNINNDGQKINNNYINNEKEEEITLYFTFKNGKELYLDLKKSLIFSEVIKKLKDKYLWLKDNIKIREYKFNKQKISEKQIVKDIGLEDESNIDIIELD